MKRRNQRGQAMVEFMLLVPLMLVMLAGTLDLGRAFHFMVEVENGARDGSRTGIVSVGTEIGPAVRAGVDGAIPNTDAVWGQTGPNGSNAINGDRSGCSASAFSVGQQACFAVRACLLSSAQGSDAGQCTQYTRWGTRLRNGFNGLQVRVVYKMATFTPFVAQLAGGGVMIQTQTTSDDLYS